MTNWDWLIVGGIAWWMLLLFVMSRCFSRQDREPLNDAIGDVFLSVVRILALLLTYTFLTYAPNPFQ